MTGARKEFLYVAAPAAALALLYFAGGNRCYPIVDDALPFVLHVHGGPVIIVHHLVFVALSWLNALLGFTGADEVGGTLLLFRAYVAATSFLTLCLVGILSLRWFGSLRMALASIALAGFTSGYWLYSMITDMPVPATAFTLLGVYFADRSFEGHRAGYARLLLASLAVLAAATNHQSHAMVVIPITAVVLLWRGGARPWKSRLARSAFFVGVTGVLGLVTYYSAYLQADSRGDFVTFIRGMEAGGKAFPTDRVQLITPVYAGVGISRAMVIPEYALHLDPAYESVSAHFRSRLLSKYRYAMRSLPDSLVRIALAVTSALLVAWVLIALRALLRLRRSPPPHPGLWMVVGWMVVQGLFSTWWLATSREFWIWMIPCMSVVGTGLAFASPRGSAGRVIPWILAAALFAVNMPALSRLWNANNCLYSVNLTYRTKLRANDLVIAPYLYSISELTALQESAAQTFLCHRGMFDFDDPALGRALAKVREEGGRVFLDPILVMPEAPEIYRLDNYTTTSRKAVEAELLRLESFCEAAAVPLYGVLRQGGGVIRFERTRFGGYLQWTGPDVSPAGTGR